MSLEDVPAYFAIYLGINETTAQVMLSVVVIFTMLLPTMYLSKGTNATTIYLIVALLAECLLVGIGWLPFWILIATVCMMAIAVAFLGGKITGGD